MGNPLGAIFAFIGGAVIWLSMESARIQHVSRTSSIIMGALILGFGLFLIFMKD